MKPSRRYVRRDRPLPGVKSQKCHPGSPGARRARRPFEWDKVYEVAGCSTGRCVNDGIAFHAMPDDWQDEGGSPSLLVFVRDGKLVRLVSILGSWLDVAHPMQAWPRTVWVVPSAHHEIVGWHLVLAASANP